MFHQLETNMSQVETIAAFETLDVAQDVSLAPRIALVAATVGAGLSAGLFYAYQVSVIRALAEVDDVTYVTSFRAINDKIQNPWFFATFLGTPPLIVAALVLNRRSVEAVRALIGAGLVLNLALFGITVFGNVPLNDDLAGYEVITPETATIARSDFEEPWNRLHLVRTLAAVGSFVALTVATILDPATRQRPRSANGHPVRRAMAGDADDSAARRRRRWAGGRPSGNVD
jgi:uncharacterized membrane protein